MVSLRGISRSITALSLFLTLCFSACSVDEPEGQHNLQFAPGGIVLPVTAVTGELQIRTPGGSARPVSPRRIGEHLLIPVSWQGSETWIIRHNEGEISATAPAEPGFVQLGSIALGNNLFELKAGSTERTPSSMALSHGGRWAAVGFSDGLIICVDIPSMQVTESIFLPDSYIRSLAFSDDDMLVAGTQNVRGSIHAWQIDRAGRMSQVWQKDAADQLGAGRPDPEDPYAWVKQPGIYRLETDGENLFALATFSRIEDGRRRADWILYCLDRSTGQSRWTAPEEAGAEGVATWFHRNGGAVSVCARLADGRGRVTLFDDSSGEETAYIDIKPLLPHTTSVDFWRSVAVNDGGDQVAIQTNDGRGFLWNAARGSVRELLLAEPLPAGDIAILVSGAGVRWLADGPVFINGTSFLPWEQAEGRKVPQPHPSAHTVVAFDSAGEQRWNVPVPNLVQGSSVDDEGAWLLLSYTSNPVFSPDGGNGLLAMKMGQKPGLHASWPMEGSVVIGSPVRDHQSGILIAVQSRQHDARREEYRGKTALHIFWW